MLVAFLDRMMGHKNIPLSVCTKTRLATFLNEKMPKKTSVSKRCPIIENVSISWLFKYVVIIFQSDKVGQNSSTNFFCSF